MAPAYFMLDSPNRKRLEGSAMLARRSQGCDKEGVKKSCNFNLDDVCNGGMKWLPKWTTRWEFVD
jgi:hypothetical protein